jgi:hypothetical protein
MIFAFEFFPALRTNFLESDKALPVTVQVLMTTTSASAFDATI